MQKKFLHCMPFRCLPLFSWMTLKKTLLVFLVRNSSRLLMGSDFWKSWFLWEESIFPSFSLFFAIELIGSDPGEQNITGFRFTVLQHTSVHCVVCSPPEVMSLSTTIYPPAPPPSPLLLAGTTLWAVPMSCCLSFPPPVLLNREQADSCWGEGLSGWRFSL